ncbi:putative HAD superfamily protein [Helianthus debilis subsp. tardiflorus]
MFCLVNLINVLGFSFAYNSNQMFCLIELINVLGSSFEDKAGVAAGMPVIGLTTRNPKHMLMKANPTLLSENYEDPKLWEVLGELNKRENDA